MLAKSHIYILIDPRNGEVRYVGQSVKPHERLGNHLCEARKGSHLHIYRWMRELLRFGMKPLLQIVEICAADEIDAAERRWIAHYRGKGDFLTNHTDGGGGIRGYKLSQQQIAKIAAANTGKKRSEETRELLRTIQNDPAMKARLSEKRKGNKSRTGQKQTDEEKARRAASNRGKKRSQEFREAMRKKATGVKHSDQTKKKISDSKLSMISPERRSEIARIGNLASQEAKKCRSRAE